MVTCRLMGGLANQLFQIAHIYSFAKKHGLQYVVPIEVINPHVAGQRAYLFPGINYAHNSLDVPDYKEKHFHYEEIPKMDGVCFDGYFQSWKYFDQYREDILKAFGFAWRPEENTCSVHVRLGDYLSQEEFHPPVTIEYLYSAMREITAVHPNIKFRVFSDDIDLCKGMLSYSMFDKFQFEFSEGTNEIRELEKISCCAHHVCANSAFSWWGAWLNQNPNKIVVMPARWFGHALPHDLKDLYPPQTIIL